MTGNSISFVSYGSSSSYIQINGSIGTFYSMMITPRIRMNSNLAPIVLYIEVYTINIGEILNYESDYIKTTWYTSTTIDINQITREYYQLGYNEGYNIGYPLGVTAGQSLVNDLNIVQHIEQLIGQFTGNEVAMYITPIAIVITILLVYFLFIRFLLSLIKAKGVLKVCDIIMVTACIAILMVMYIPMINLEITQHQIVETIYRVAQDTIITNIQ